MKQKVTKSRKARVRCLSHTYNFLHQAPVWLRRQMGFYGADWRTFSEIHGILKMSPTDPIR